MAKVSRMSKYKDLREGIKTDVEPNTQSSNDTVKELNSLSDHDFIREFPKIEDEDVAQPVTLTNPNQEDTFVEAVTLDKLNAQVDEELQRALTRVRQDAGHDDFNTRMDILNRIRQSQIDAKDDSESIQPVLVDDDTDDALKQSPMGLINNDDTDYLNETSDEIEEIEEDDISNTKKHRFGFFKKEDEDENEEYDDDDEYDDDSEDVVEHSKFVKILNGIIVVLVLILIGLLGYFAKEFFF